MKNKYAQFKYIALFTQFSLSIITPLFLLILLAGWLRGKYGLGVWIMVIAVVTGIAAAGYNMYRLLRFILSDLKKEENLSKKRTESTDHETK